MMKGKTIGRGILIAISLFFLAACGTSAVWAADLNLIEPMPAIKLAPLEQKGLWYASDNLTQQIKFLTNPQGVLSISKKPKSVREAGSIFLKDYGKYFGVKNLASDLKYVQTKIGITGKKYLQYEQLYKGVPVYGGNMVVAVKSDLSVVHAIGKMQTKISVATTPKITLANAQKATVKYAKNILGLVDPEVVNVKLYIFNRNFLNSQEKSKNYLAWKMELRDKKGFGREYLFVNAQNGSIIYRLSGLRSIDRNVCDCRTSGGCHTGRLVECGANLREEGDPVYGAADVDDLYDQLGKAHDYFSQTFGINGANNLGGMGSGSAAHPSNATDGYAFHVPTSTWGRCPNSYWTGYGITFCQNIVNQALVGHEYGHAVNEFNSASRLDYENESGQLEEGMADIWGAAVENFATGNTDWQFSPRAGVIWRDIINLTNQAGKAPSTTYDANYQCIPAGGVPTSTNDFGFVHDNSVVVSHMAYLLGQGGSMNGCDITGIGQDKVEKLFFLALPNITNNSDFGDLFQIMIGECNGEYGLGSQTCASVIRAMQAAELDQRGRCSGVAERAPLCRLPLLEIKDYNFDRLIKFFPPKPPVDLPDEITHPKVNLPVITLPPPPPPPPIDKTKPPIVDLPVVVPPVIEEKEVRTPSFDVTVDQDGKHVTITGVLHYYGKGSKCSGPRYFDPIIVRWGQVDSHPALVGDTFIASHDYIVRNKTYDLSVSVINSCFGSYTFHKTLTFPL